MKIPVIRRWILRVIFILALSAAVCGLVAFLFPQQVLTVDSGPVKADMMVVLGGTPDRAVRAAELFKQDEAPEILVSGSGDSASNKKLLERNGVTNAAIILESKSRTTRENAEFSIPLLRSLGARRVIIVTSWYHSRRALACFEHYAPDIQFYSRPSYYGYVDKHKNAETLKTEILKTEARKAGGTNFSVSEFQLSAFKAKQKAEWKRVQGYADSEYAKLLGYWLCYGVCPI
jgi:uncharacterized SAM-binding protein YcdF (DUF218 family)